MIEARFVDADGVRTRYLEAGSGEPLLLVHGGQAGGYTTADDFRPVIEPLARNFRVLSIDKVGCGFSDNPRSDDDYLLSGTVRHLRAFLHSLKIDTAHLVGHSRGGYGVTRLALENPEMVSTVINVSSATLIGGETPYDGWFARMQQMEDLREKARYFFAVNSWSDAHIDDHLVDTTVEVLRRPQHNEAWRKAQELGRTFKSAMDAETAEARQRIASGGLKMPALVVWGYNDPSATFDPMGIDTIRLFLSSVEFSEAHVLPRAGHYCFREQPDAFAAVLADFIMRNGKRRRLG
jgi:2-hydroxy-6-oxonona-2,4-dienedioate hydrolase